MRLLWFTALWLAWAAAGWAQGQVLWQIESKISPTLPPAYRGQLSPFPQPKVEVAVVSNPEAESAAQQARLGAAAKARAQALVNPRVALQMVPGILAVKAVTNGSNGVQVLLGNRWYRTRQPIPARYTINPNTMAALRELQQFDPKAAQAMATKLEELQKEYTKQGVRIMSVRRDLNEMRVDTPHGLLVMPLSRR